jgi:hypothetical protein
VQQNADNNGKHGNHVDHEGEIENERTHGRRAYPSETGFPAPQSDENSISNLFSQGFWDRGWKGF